MLNFTSRTKYYLSSHPTDMRKGREGLAGVIREVMQRDPYEYGESELREKIAHERELRQEAESKIAILEVKNKNDNN